MSTKKKISTAKAKRKSGAGAEARFVRDLITRGEAVPEPEKPQAPAPGVTHWLVEGKPAVKRVRFSMK